MKKKLNLIALVLSMVAFGTCLVILLLGYYQGNDENHLMVLIMTGLSLGLISINLANYRRSKGDT